MNIGELLLESGLISKKDFDNAIKQQEVSSKTIEELLIDSRVITYDMLIKYIEMEILKHN